MEKTLQNTEDLGRWVLFSTILASSMAFIDGSALNVSLPAIQAAFNASGAQLLWVINAYLVMLAALILVGGSLGDTIGRKKVFMAGIGLFMVASLACGIAPSIQFLIGARVVEGIGGAFMIPGSLSIITTFFSENERGKAIGTWSSATTIVTIAGPVLGGILSNAGLWRGIFLINLPLGIIALVILSWKVPESRSEQSSRSIDIIGAALVTIGLACLAYAFISAPDMGFGNPSVVATLIVGIISLVAFVFVEKRSEQAMMPLYLFRSGVFSGANLLTLFLYGALSAGSFFISLNLIQAQGYNMAVAGITFIPFTLLLTVLSPWAGRFADRHGSRWLLVIGPLTVGLGYLALSFPGLTRGPSEYWYTFFPGIILMGIGMGITVAPLTATVMGSVGQNNAGKASGINNAVSRTAGVLAIAVIGAVALLLFAGALDARSAPISLPADARANLHAEANRLGDATAPPQVPSADIAAVNKAIKLAFVDVFHRIMWICAGAAWLSALMTFLFIRKGRSAEESSR